jgi:1,4-alpha-glucan branching enzyme
MGAEIGQRSEWSHDGALDWPLTEFEPHRGIQRLVADLNRVYSEEPALHELDCDPTGFEWAIVNDSANSVLAYFRRSADGSTVLVAVNLTPVPRHAYRIGVPGPGRWVEILNTDAEIYGGSGQGNLGGVDTGPLAVPHHGRPHSVDLTVPPLGLVALRHEPMAVKGGVAGGRP